MFVNIKEFKSALEVENLLTPYKRGKAEITPEVCQEVLEATNYKRNIRDMLECILKLPAEKQAGFKEAVLNTFEQREQPNEVLVLGKKLAALGGYEAEFGDVAKVQEGEFLCSGVGVAKGLATFMGEEAGRWFSIYSKMIFLGNEADLLNIDDLRDGVDVSRCKKVRLAGCNLAGIKLKFAEGAKVDLTNTENIPADLDVSMCSEVVLRRCDLKGMNLKFAEGAEADLTNATNIPADLDVSRCGKVNLWGDNLEDVKNLQFAAGAKVDLSNATNIPADLDVSMCSTADLRYCDLAGLKLSFAEGAMADLSYAENIPADLDISRCSVVNLRECNLAGMNLKFADGAKVDLFDAKNLPADLDVSMCSNVNLGSCDLAGMDLKFAEGAEVILWNSKNIPADLDVSMCSTVRLVGCDLSVVEKLRFKNREQMRESRVKLPENWGGELAFAEEEKTTGMDAAKVLAMQDNKGR